MTLKDARPRVHAKAIPPLLDAGDVCKVLASIIGVDEAVRDGTESCRDGLA
jgi:hypothetical protein